MHSTRVHKLTGTSHAILRVNLTKMAWELREMQSFCSRLQLFSLKASSSIICFVFEFTITYGLVVYIVYLILVQEEAECELLCQVSDYVGLEISIFNPFPYTYNKGWGN